MRFSSTLVKCAALVLLLNSCDEQPTNQRPHDPWVFRSVLDKQARMITIALHDQVWVAYDAANARLYKAWRGGVNFDGAVYTTVHGPQPTSKGQQYLVNDIANPQWYLVENGETYVPQIQYKGHQFMEGRVAINFVVLTRNGQQINVSESPEYAVYGSAYPGLERKFTTANVPEGTDLVLQVNWSSMPTSTGYYTDGELFDTSLDEHDYSWGKRYDLVGKVKLNPNGETNISSYFIQPPMARVIDIDPNSLVKSGVQLISGSDCYTCHNTWKRTVGPSFLEIANFYDNNSENKDYLADKIIHGGSGVWGEVPMTAHENLKKQDAAIMVDYILSLAIDEKDVASGILMRYFDIGEPMTTLRQVRPGQNPNSSKVFPTLDLSRTSDFEGLTRDFIAIGDAEIIIPEATKYAFRLISSGGARLLIDDQVVIDHTELHATSAMDGELELSEGGHRLKVEYFQNGPEKRLALLWSPHGSEGFQAIPSSNLTTYGGKVWTSPGSKPLVPFKRIPGDGEPLVDVHPSYDLDTLRPENLRPRIGGIDFLEDGRMVFSTWDSLGAIYLLDNFQEKSPQNVTYKVIASGLAEPLGVKVVDGDIYVMQKQELTQLIDHDGDDHIDEYRTVANDWGATANFHEFGFGLVYQDEHFYAALATAINPGGASTQPQNPDRGKAIKISKDGKVTFVAHGLRTPNGVGVGVDNEIFITDNQGDWLPSSKLLHLQENAFYGSHSVDPIGTANLKETPPVVWLPQDDIGNSPSQPIYLNDGPYAGQMIHGEVTHGGLKRVFVEKVNGQYQGVVFRFTQGLEAGINRVCWGPDGALYVGGVGSTGNWSHEGKNWYGLQRLKYNGKSTFEMLAIRAKSNGIEIEFTEPLAAGQGWYAKDYLVKQWWYKPTPEYGGPKMDEEQLAIRSVNVSQDRKKVFLQLTGMKPAHVLYVRIMNPFMSENKHDLWTTEGWYTLNQIPADSPGFQTSGPGPKLDNQLTELEKASGWKLLFDGKTTTNWKGYLSPTVGDRWRVDNGTLMFTGKAQTGGWQQQDIITQKTYEDFELVLEWKISKGSNSGVLYGVIEDEEYEHIWLTGLEMQIMDDEARPEDDRHKHLSGDLFGVIASKYQTANPVGQWNSIRIVKDNGVVQHWQNGYKVLEFDMNSAAWKEILAKTKFKDMPAFGVAKSGHIALQDHQNAVWFRNIKIKEL